MENTNEKKQSVLSKPWMQSLIGLLVIIAALIGFLYWKSSSAYVAIDMSQISAPVISIGPEASGILSEVYVKAGDFVTVDEPVARVGSETLSAKADGIVISVQNTPGQVFAPGTAVITMIEPTELRVVGKIDEDKGLSKITVGEPATFTVDAFGSQKFTGVVDEVSPTSNQSGVVFSISDKREIKQFDVKVRFDVAAHPEFKNGMSAKLKVYAK
jgi:multidrug resistance efflux pump